ncbi:uncharacterized protein LOC121876027 [Homarus americanus]|nr:uncharacterized protein LOC121876027 [Homarus americanus]
MWRRQLSADEVMEMASCHLNTPGDVFSSALAKFEVFGNVTEMSMPIKQLCSVSPNYLIIPEARNFLDSTTLCRSFNASPAVPSSSSDNHILYSALQPFLNICNPSASWKLWIGLTDVLEDGVWRNVLTQEVASYLNFSNEFPVLGTIYNCVEMVEGGLWTVDACDQTTKRCAACHIEREHFLSLRGLCFEDEHQTRFRLNGHVNGRPVFWGYYDYIIIWDILDNRWSLKNTISNVTVAWTEVLDLTEYPLGRRMWRLEESLCGAPQGSNLRLGLSPCSLQQFMCHSGSCIAAHLRCNLRYDCEDGSDEDECEVVVMKGGYQKHLAPAGSGGSLLTVTPSVTLARVASVDEINQAITLELELSLAWKDDRLVFKHLGVTTEGGLLSQAEMGQVWLPRHQLTNLEGGKIKQLHQAVVVRGTDTVQKPGFNSVDTDLVYPGAQMTITQRYTATLTCSFELYSYPFDAQLCTIDLTFPPDYKGNVKFAVNNTNIIYTGKKKLSLFVVENVKLSGKSSESLVVVEYQLNRRQGVILLTTFLPSFLLLSISWATLFIRIEDLNVRAVMSLTTLLVLYTLFSNLSSSLPKTAEIKLIDVWFIFIISLLFSNIMAHIFAGAVEATVKYPKRMTVVPRDQTEIQVKKPASGRLLYIQRYLIIPFVFIVFNIVFWSQVFR